MFILQFNNVPEWPVTTARGLLMAQVVLHEGSNAITMYTNTMSTTRIGRRVTQGIENADGSVAYVGDSVLLANGMKTPRVKAVYRLTEDQIRFTPVGGTADTEAPSISAPANIEDFHNDPGLGSAVDRQRGLTYKRPITARWKATRLACAAMVPRSMLLIRLASPRSPGPRATRLATLPRLRSRLK